MTTGPLEAGRPEPLGATCDGDGVNFALFSAAAEQVALCLFDADGRAEIARHPLPGRTGDVWHGFLPGAGPGLVYGYRVDGPYRPRDGHRFNPHKLLLDPYARRLTGALVWHSANFAYWFGSGNDMTFDRRDNAAYVPKGVVAPPETAGQAAAGPSTAWADTVVYELHVRGMTLRHPGVPERWRGRLSGLATPAVIDHLTGLGVTAVELMPIFAFADETHLARRGLVNYWGYNPYNFFAVEPRYLTPGAERELRGVVDRLHEAGIEVILDVVFNHTGEGDRLGPTLSFRGIDNASYYRLAPDDPRDYVNVTGCGNTLDTNHPMVQRLVLDALRHWAGTADIDGFRFDLGLTLGRDGDGHFDPDHPLLAAIAADPVLCGVKLIAEPWDLGPGGHRLGAFAHGWAEWNDRFRDDTRAFWRGDAGAVGGLATRLAGSSDLFQPVGRPPQAGINFITAHDGFTLADLVSYADKHNHANGEDNRDGHAHNLSANWGVEGPTDDAHVRTIRARLTRSLLATLFLSQGVPMLLAGDEIGRTQQGNNNAYCQDTPMSWLDWDLGDEQHRLLAFVQRLIALRRSHPAFRRTAFFTGAPQAAGADKDITWLRPDGTEMAETDWTHHDRKTLGCRLGAADGGGPLLLLLNAGRAEVFFVLTAPAGVRHWSVLLDTGRDRPDGDGFAVGSAYPLLAHALVLLEAADHEPG